MTKPDNKNKSESSDDLGEADIKFDSADVYVIHSALTLYYDINFDHLSKYDKHILNHTMNAFNPDKDYNHNEQVSAKMMLYTALALHFVHTHFNDILPVLKHDLDKNSLNVLKTHFAKTEDKIIVYCRQCQFVSETPDDIMKRLNRDIRWAKHGYIRSALDDIFKFYFINHKTSTDEPLDLLSIFAVHVMDDHSSDANYAFYVLDSVIQGNKFAIKHHDSDVDTLINNIEIFHDLRKQGLKYIICDSQPMPHKVTLHDFMKLANSIKKLCNQLTKPEYRTDSDK